MLCGGKEEQRRIYALSWIQFFSGFSFQSSEWLAAVQGSRSYFLLHCPPPSVVAVGETKQTKLACQILVFLSN